MTFIGTRFRIETPEIVQDGKCGIEQADLLVEQREARSTASKPLPQLIRELNRARRGDTLYVRLISSDAGAAINGETLTSLPPSVLAVMQSDRSGGVNALTNATVGEWSVPIDRAVTGSKAVSLTLRK